ncbi:SAM-dependent methyltransferase [Astrocystis sublimbata]|nr:SAM-dependent methyltransferase [Astrocystis sublimbata]
MSAEISFDPVNIARLSLHDPNNFRIQCAQTMHRIMFMQHWNIAAGSKVLEIGCGQGDCTTVLATAVGEEGKVVAVDPGSLDYGAPYTLGQAQDHISLGPLGERITWIHENSLAYLTRLPSTERFDEAVFAHCLWYFDSPIDIVRLLKAVKQRSKRLLIAEWALASRNPCGQPHVLAALAQASLECRKPGNSQSNIRIALGPSRLIEVAKAAGWRLESQANLHAGIGLLDGQWEVAACLSPSFKQDVIKYVTDDKEKAVVAAVRDACETSLANVPGGMSKVLAMDTWVATFV